MSYSIISFETNIPDTMAFAQDDDDIWFTLGIKNTGKKKITSISLNFVSVNIDGLSIEYSTVFSWTQVVSIASGSTDYITFYNSNKSKTTAFESNVRYLTGQFNIETNTDSIITSDGIDGKDYKILNKKYNPQLSNIQCSRSTNENSEGLIISSLESSISSGASGFSIKIISNDVSSFETLSGTSITSSNPVTVFSNYSFSAGKIYDFIFEYTDGYESCKVSYTLLAEFANLHLAPFQSGGVAIGKFSSATSGHPLFECDYPAIFNKGVSINGITNFSSNEIDTGGKWIDNKSIYIKSFEITNTSSNTEETNSEILFLDNIINIQGTMHRTSGEQYYSPIEIYRTSGNNSYVRYKKGTNGTSDKIITLDTNATSNKSTTFFITLYYTKNNENMPGGSS